MKTTEGATKKFFQLRLPHDNTVWQAYDKYRKTLRHSEEALSGASSPLIREMPTTLITNATYLWIMPLMYVLKSTQFGVQL